MTKTNYSKTKIKKTFQDMIKTNYSKTNMKKPFKT
jgi:hypothetical protein